ncbi:MAG: DUF4390 domain-containing protein [Gammaproteobacteria bacterium]|nr:DUF4390 domain-containing protein [Gammaproteobacteria bacterium]
MNSRPTRPDRSHAAPAPLGAGAARARPAFLIVALFLASFAFADGLAGSFAVQSARLELRGGVYHLDARFKLPVDAAVEHGLAAGVPLALEVDLEIKRVRRFLPDATVAELAQRYQLQYNAVSARYILRNLNSGQQVSFPTVAAALAELSAVQDLPVLDRSLIAMPGTYEASVRATLDYGTVPLTLRLLMFWVDDWHRESDWYTWTLKP